MRTLLFTVSVAIWLSGFAAAVIVDRHLFAPVRCPVEAPVLLEPPYRDGAIPAPEWHHVSARP